MCVWLVLCLQQVCVAGEVFTSTKPQADTVSSHNSADKTNKQNKTHGYTPIHSNKVYLYSPNKKTSLPPSNLIF